MTSIVLIKAGHRTVRQHFSPPLGVLSLAAYLREKDPSLQFTVIDMAARGLTAEQAVKLALEKSPALAGVSAMSLEAKDLHALSAGLKKQNPALPVIAGGPHATTSKAKVFEDKNLDAIVIGEGELTLTELLPRLLAGDRDLSGIKGIAFRKGAEVIVTPPRDEIVDLDTLPLPAFDLIDLPRYWDLPRFGTTYVHKKYATLSTSRACPYRCTYCHRIFGSHYRSQKPETVLRDLETLQRDFGVHEVSFVDDCFNLDKKRVAAICDGVREKGLDFAFSFPNGIRGDIMDEATLDKLKAAGTYRITYAIETASPRIQAFIKKNVKLGRLKEIIAATDARDIMVDGFFMVGFPGEKREEIEMTFNYALTSKLHSANFWFVTPFEGTELLSQAREMGLKLESDPDSLHYFDPSTDLSEVPAAELKKLVQRAFFRFYLNPWRLLRIFKLFPNKGQLPELFVRFVKLALKWN